jgi:hypothetical protein
MHGSRSAPGSCAYLPHSFNPALRRKAAESGQTDRANAQVERLPQVELLVSALPYLQVHDNFGRRPRGAEAALLLGCWATDHI